MSTPERRTAPHRQVERIPPTATATGDEQRVVPILNEGHCVVASLPAAMTDTMLLRLRDDVLSHLGPQGARGVVIDVQAVDVLDAFTVRILNSLAQMASLQHAGVVVTGLRADLTFAMGRLGLTLQGMATSDTLADGLITLTERSEPPLRAGA